MSKNQGKQEQAEVFKPYLSMATALRERFRESYTMSDLRADLLAGFVVGMVAIPLGMALAIATGVPPQYGLYTVVLGGLVALLGGSRFSVTGPTAAFVVILAPIVHQHGLSGLLMASAIAGVILFFLGATRLGQVITFIPYPVTTGFTSGIAVVIAVIQIKDFFGLKIDHLPDPFFERIAALIKSAGTFSLSELGISSLTLGLLALWPRINKRIPSPIVVLSLITVLAYVLKQAFPSLEIATIRDRFSYMDGGILKHGIPSALPMFSLPWNFNGSSFDLNMTNLQAVSLAGFAIALLGAIESLLCAVVADGITQTKHDPNAELLALGIGNIVGPFFGAIPATGAIVRTATNIRFGARSPLAAIFHAIIVLLIIVFTADYVSYVPMSALAGLLMYVSYGMFDSKHFFHCIKLSPRSDRTVLLTCFTLTVCFDMVVGVTIGVVLAALLFIQRMSYVTTGSAIMGAHHKLPEQLPEGIMVYEIAGPLFFGAAQRAIEGAKVANKTIKSVVFNFENVPTMDLTGLIAFESAVLELKNRDISIHISNVSPQPLKLLSRSKVLRSNPQIHIESTLKQALGYAKTDLLKTLI